jgi:hypothetical protein
LRLFPSPLRAARYFFFIEILKSRSARAYAMLVAIAWRDVGHASSITFDARHTPA